MTVGTYKFHFELDTEHELSKFYVGDIRNVDNYNIIPGNIIITAHGTSVYGSKINITVDIDKPEGVELTSGMFGVDNPEAFPFVGNYNLKKSRITSLSIRMTRKTIKSLIFSVYIP